MPDVTRWWWIRHGPTAAVGFCGWSDPPADLTAVETLAALRATLPEDATLVSSDLRRAVQTADALARRHWRRERPSADLREQHFGAWEGRDPADVAPADAPFWADPVDVAPPGGERFRDVVERTAAAIAARRSADDENVVVVAHAGVIRAALAVALGAEPKSALAFEIAPLSLTRIDHFPEADAWRVAAVNLGY